MKILWVLGVLVVFAGIASSNQPFTQILTQIRDKCRQRLQNPQNDTGIYNIALKKSVQQDPDLANSKEKQIAMICFFETMGMVMNKLPEQNLLDLCKSRSNATQDAVDRITWMTTDLDQSLEGKCMIGCLMEATGVVKRDGTMNEERTKKFFERGFPGNPQKYMDLWTPCFKNFEGGDISVVCNNAYSIYKCFLDGYHKLPDEKKIDMKVLDTCKAKTNASQSAIESFLKVGEAELDSSPEGKCLIRCILEDLGTLGQDGSLNALSSKIIVNRAFPNDSKAVMESWTICYGRTDLVPDRCNFAWSWMKCFYDDLHQKKIKPSLN